MIIDDDYKYNRPSHGLVVDITKRQRIYHLVHGNLPKPSVVLDHGAQYIVKKNTIFMGVFFTKSFGEVLFITQNTFNVKDIYEKIISR